MSRKPKTDTKICLHSGHQFQVQRSKVKVKKSWGYNNRKMCCKFWIKVRQSSNLV